MKKEWLQIRDKGDASRAKLDTVLSDARGDREVNYTFLIKASISYMVKEYKKNKGIGEAAKFLEDLRQLA